MAKQKLETDKDKPTPELDFDFDSEFSSELNQEAIGGKDRSVVKDVIRGTASEVGRTLISPSTYKSILKETLPPEYGDITTGAAEITGGIRDLYNQTFRELNPKINSIFKSLDRFVPESQKTLKKIVKKIDEATGERDYSTAGSVNKEEQTNQAVSGILGDVFDAQRAQGKIAEAKQVVRDKIDHDRFSKTFSLTDGMSRDISTIAQYTTKITQAYQRKDLELSARSYLANQEFHAKVLNLLETNRAQQEAIVKNTGLPDFVKITKSEQFMERTRARFIDSLYGEGSPLQKGMTKLKDRAAEFVSGISRSLSMADMALEGAASQKEMIDAMNQQSIDAGMGPIFSKAEMAGMGIGTMGMGWLREKAVDRLKPMLDKNNDLKEQIGKYSKYATNPGAQIAKFRQSDEWQGKLNAEGGNRTAKVLDFILEQFQDSDSPNRSIVSGHGLDDLDAPQPGFSKRASLSLTTVIPGHLAHIHREIAMLRTGSKDAPLLTYDYRMGDFTTKSKMSSRIASALKEEVGRSTYGGATSNAANNMLGEKASEVSEKAKLGLRVFLSRLSREDDLMLDDIDAIKATSAYQSMSEDVQKLIDDYFEEVSSGDNFHMKTAQFTKDVRHIRSSMPSLDRRMKEYVDAGYGDELTATGLVKKSSDGSRLDVDEEKFYDMIEKETHTYASDMNVKEKIKALSPSALLKRNDQKTGMMDRIRSLGKTAGKHLNPKEAYEGMRKTKLFSYFYKKGMDDGQQHDGPMAQEVQQNLGNDVAPNGKAIDVQSLSGSFFASIKYLGDKYDELFKKSEDKEEAHEPSTARNRRPRGKNSQIGYLSDIANNTATMAALLGKKGVVIAGVTGPAGLTGNGAPQSFAEAMGQAISFASSNVKTGVIDPTLRGAQAAGKYAGELYDKHRDPMIEKAGKARDWIFERMNEGISFGSGIAAQIPEFIKKGKDRINSLIDSAKDKFTEYKDLYLPGGVEPVIRAAKIRAGFYIDEETGEPLTTMQQIMACKNNIVDSAGNVLLSAQEKGQGLYDRYGEQIKGFGSKVSNAVAGVAGQLFKGASDLFKGIRDGDFLKNLKDGFKKRMTGFKNFLSANNPFSGGFGIESTMFLRKIYDEIVNVRDIMLGETEDVMKRLKKKTKKLLTGAAEALGLLPPGETVNEAATDIGGAAAAPNGFGALGRGWTAARGLAQRAKDKYNERFGKKPAEAGAAGAGNTASPDASPNTTGKGNKTPNKAGINWRGKKGQMMAGDKAAALSGAATGGGVFDRMKSKISPKTSARMSKAWNLTKRGGGKVGRFISGAMSLFGSMGGQDQAQNGEAPDKTDGQEEDAENNQRDDYSGINKVPGQGTVAAKDRAWNDKDGTGDRDGGVADREAKLNAIKESRKRDQQKADLTPKYLGAAGTMGAAFLTGIGDKITALFDVTSSLFKRIPGMDKLLGGAKNMLGRAGPALSNMGRGLAQRFGAQGLRTAGTMVARQVGMAGLRAAAVTGLQALAASSAGAAAVAAAPIILTVAAIAATSYGLYRLYKYTRRDDMTKFDQLRLRQYGFAYRDNVYRFNHYVYQLEDYLQDERIGFDKLSNKAYLIKAKIKGEELFEAMDIDPKDAEATENFNGWFKERFCPVFLAHMTALYKQDPKMKLKLKDVGSKLDVTQRLVYLEDTHLKDTAPYNYDISPVKELDSLDVNTDDIETSFKNLIDKEKEAEEKGSKAAPIPEPVMKAAEKAKSDLMKQAAEKAALANAQANASKSQLPGSGDKAKALTPEERMRVDDAAKAEGDGRGVGNITSMTNLPTSGKNSLLGKAPIPMAGGAVLNGEGGLAYINRPAHVNIENLHPSMLRMFLGMAEEYGQLTGKRINVNSAFRSYAQQAALHAKDPAKASKPGGSLHELGMAIDINSVDANELERLGLMKKYGFTRPVGREPWHLEPAGIQKSIAQAKASAEVAAVMIEAGKGRGGGGYGTLPDSQQSRRNNELALSLLSAAPSEVKAETPSSAPMTPITPPPTQPSREADLIRPSQAAKDPSVSKAQQLPASTEGARAKVTAEDGEPEKNWNNSTASVAGGNTSVVGTGKEAMKQIITESAKRVGVDPGIPLVFAAAESGFNPNARAGSSNGNHSSASGLMQFVDGTWRGVMKQHGAKYGIDPSTPQTDPRAASLLGAEYIKDNMKAISGVRPNPTAGDVYMAHFLGAGGAKKFFSQDQNQPAAIGMPKEAASNRSIFYDKSGRARTSAEVYQLMTSKLKKRASEEGINVNVQNTAAASPSSSSSSSASPSSVNQTATPAAPAPDAKTAAPASLAQVGAFIPPPISSGDTSSPQNSVVESKVDRAAPAVPRSPFSFDTRFPGKLPTMSQDAAASPPAISMTGVEGLMTKSVDIQEKSYQALQELVKLLNPERFAATLAKATAAAIPQPGEAKPDVKEQDKINMGRTSQVASSSLDLRRRSA